MASIEVYDAIRAYLVANWTATAIGFDNEDKDTSENPFPPDDAQVPWVEVDMFGRLYAQESIGASVQADNRWDEEGALLLHVVVPSGSGSRQARTHGKALADLFRGLHLLSDDLEFLEASLLPGAGDEDGNWFRITVSIEWRRWDA